MTAATVVSRATDGHTLGIVLGGPTTTAKALNPNLAYVPAKDFRPISLLTRTPFVLTVHPGSFAGQQFADVIDYARAHPGRLSYASIGPGTATHLAMEELKSQLGLDIVHVPLPRLSAGDARSRCRSLPTHVQRSKRCVGTRGRGPADGGGADRRQATRHAYQCADAARTQPGIQPFFGWSGDHRPANFPEATALRLADVIRSAFASDPGARGGLDRAGSEVLGTDPTVLELFREKEAARWNAVIARLGLKSAE